MIRREIDFTLDDGTSVLCSGNLVDRRIEDLSVERDDLPEHVIQTIYELLLDQDD